MSLYNKSKILIKILSLLLFATLSNQANSIDQQIRINELRIVDQQLNVYYQKIMRYLDSSEQIKFKKAQRHWIVFRDLDCTWAFKKDPYMCLVERTRDRLREFQANSFYYIYYCSYYIGCRSNES